MFHSLFKNYWWLWCTSTSEDKHSLISGNNQELITSNIREYWSFCWKDNYSSCLNMKSCIIDFQLDTLKQPFFYKIKIDNNFNWITCSEHSRQSHLSLQSIDRCYHQCTQLLETSISSYIQLPVCDFSVSHENMWAILSNLKSWVLTGGFPGC